MVEKYWLEEEVKVEKYYLLNSTSACNWHFYFKKYITGELLLTYNGN